ncbi:cilia- and flagella-associated protein 221 [Chanos chanos]|uniref:Cilia- and flagella-associated protein 221 n=1 Tax=Chanos chanos TaxID=29144 RepID=A0A6J2VT86_CHACN|nr:cilia- and flagella-associated protein 221 [Chanos chanos]
MEVMHGPPETFQGTLNRKNRLPLGQLIEDTRESVHVPHHPLETRIYTKLKGNSVLQVEPSELHFSGFKLGEVYQKVLKLINVSSEVTNVHILPTQTKYFQTEYSKKNRLVPGLCYTVVVHFCPDEWRYFYDSIRLHCKGEENLIVPVHAYPVIGDLHIPSHISLPSVPLGQSFVHVIPLNCSCPIDFEFQVHCLRAHKAFSVHPLSGIIPANGKADITVTFRPLQYGTHEITFQVVISQFNSKPFVCTLTGLCSPCLVLSQQECKEENISVLGEDKSVLTSVSVGTKPKHRSVRTLKKAAKEQRDSDVPCLQSAADVCSPAGLAKMLIKQDDKMTFKDLREAMSQTKMGLQTRQVKEAVFENRVRQDAQEERWQVHLDFCSTQRKLQILEEQEQANSDYMMRRGDRGKEEDFTRARSESSARRFLHNAEQPPERASASHVYSNSHLEIRQRVTQLFQQASRKVVLQCRRNKRLLPLRALTDNMKKLSRGGKLSEVNGSVCPLKLCGENLQPFTFPTFSSPDELDELSVRTLGPVPVQPTKTEMTPCAPVFSLKVPQHYRLMRYQPVNPFEAAVTLFPPVPSVTLRSGAQDELWPSVGCVEDGSTEVGVEGQKDDQALQQNRAPTLTFTAPTALSKPPQAHPLRIFNPAPGVHAFKQTMSYLECNLDFHLCPLPKYTISKSEVACVYTPSTQKKFLDRKDIIKGVMTWKKFPSPALYALSNTSTLSSNVDQQLPRMSDPFNTDILPSLAPAPLADLPEDIRVEIQDEQ